MFVTFNSNFRINSINWFKFSVIQWMTKLTTRMAQKGMFFMMNKFRVYLLKPSSVKDEKINGHVIFRYLKGRTTISTSEHTSLYATEVLRNCVSSYYRGMSKKPVLEFD